MELGKDFRITRAVRRGLDIGRLRKKGLKYASSDVIVKLRSLRERFTLVSYNGLSKLKALSPYVIELHSRFLDMNKFSSLPG